MRQADRTEAYGLLLWHLQAACKLGCFDTLRKIVLRSAMLPRDAHKVLPQSDTSESSLEYYEQMTPRERNPTPSSTMPTGWMRC